MKGSHGVAGARQSFLAVRSIFEQNGKIFSEVVSALEQFLSGLFLVLLSFFLCSYSLFLSLSLSLSLSLCR
jgi:hypothetical protein